MSSEGFIETHYQGKVFEAFYVHNQTAQHRPVVLIFHPWRGRDEFVKDRAFQLSRMGYFAVAVDLYGKGIVGKDDEECEKLMMPMIENRLEIYEKVLKIIDQLKENPYADVNQIAAIGFCFGGLCALDMARRMKQLRGVVSFHGLLLPLESHQKISGKVLILHGYKDPMVSIKDLEMVAKEMEEAETNFEIIIYGKAYHAFTNPLVNSPQKGTVYNEEIAKRAYLAMQNFLHEIFIGQFH